jgi:multidrug efflux system membrane fusion protein
VPVRVSVIATPAKPGSLPILRRTIGNIVPVLSVSLSSPVSGTIADIVASDGQSVTRGQLLARLDDNFLKATIERDKALLAKDQASLDNANAAYARAQSLIASGADSKQQHDDALAAVKVAQSAVAFDKANLDADLVLLSQMEIRAPFDGMLGAFHLSPGAFVSPGAQVVSLTGMKPVYAEFTLPETDLSLIRTANATGKLSMEATPMEVGDNSASASGPVTFIDNAIDRASSTFTIRARLENEQGQFWPGQTLNVLVDAGQVDDLLLVPLVAVQSRTGGAICYVVKPDHTIEIRKVDVALRVGDEAGIIRGLAAGELVVIEGQSSLENGTPILLQNARAAPVRAASHQKGAP